MRRSQREGVERLQGNQDEGEGEGGHTFGFGAIIGLFFFHHNFVLVVSF